MEEENDVKIKAKFLGQVGITTREDYVDALYMIV